MAILRWFYSKFGSLNLQAKQLASEMQLHQDSITALNKLVASLNQRELDSQTKLEEAQTHFDTLAGDNRQLKQQLAGT